MFISISQHTSRTQRKRYLRESVCVWGRKKKIEKQQREKERKVEIKNAQDSKGR